MCTPWSSRCPPFLHSFVIIHMIAIHCNECFCLVYLRAVVNGIFNCDIQSSFLEVQFGNTWHLPNLPKLGKLYQLSCYSTRKSEATHFNSLKQYRLCKEYHENIDDSLNVAYFCVVMFFRCLSFRFFQAPGNELQEPYKSNSKPITENTPIFSLRPHDLMSSGQMTCIILLVAGKFKCTEERPTPTHRHPSKRGVVFQFFSYPLIMLSLPPAELIAGTSPDARCLLNHDLMQWEGF